MFAVLLQENKYVPFECKFLKHTPMVLPIRSRFLLETFKTCCDEMKTIYCVTFENGNTFQQGNINGIWRSCICDLQVLVTGWNWTKTILLYILTMKIPLNMAPLMEPSTKLSMLAVTKEKKINCCCWQIGIPLNMAPLMEPSIKFSMLAKMK